MTGEESLASAPARIDRRTAEATPRVYGGPFDRCRLVCCAP